MKTVFITGATSGIGQEFARVYAKIGYRLILTGRRTDRLEAMRTKIGENCKVITTDLSDESQCKKLLESISEEHIDVFINNAGFGTAGSFLETDLKKEISMIKVNDIAMHILFKGVLRKMKAQGTGTILNVASSAGLLPAGPYMATYYASKAYVVSLTKAVARELKEQGSGVYVCCLCPGPVDTEFNSKSDVMFALKGISAKQCVKECLTGMKKRQTVIIPTLGMKLAIAFQHFIPESLLIMITGRQQKKKRR
ncbi:SDR family NAD(P)-dependent oxidoreductase [Butyrivibrio sp. AD3002]|uniref:SDR family NAD(P)-dependent oxidoreductase n=1 Tax=Butyrivibrio sp. AD3002 TaxID=1280670 RepID=UPI0003B66E9B|nr:SDR family oxidoreductase [Butyrivibrio sp. AD3002]